MAGKQELKLAVCDVTACEAMCCHDGVYLEPQEEAFLRELVERVPALKAHLPQEFIVEGWFQGEHWGRKTATRPQHYESPDFPAHFTRTRCVFGDSQGFCELEKLGRARGQHPWTFKPSVCWMFPLEESRGVARPPSPDAKQDPQRSKDYPGYVSCVGCGRHDAAGKPWREALTAELQWYQQCKPLPVLGSPGHTVDELLR